MILIALNKPFNVLCQFQDENGRRTLADLVPVPGVYPAGRLDYSSEGLVLLTDMGRLQQRISDPSRKLWKTYLVQVEGELSLGAIHQLSDGVRYQDILSLPAQARQVPEPNWIWPRIPPIRLRKDIPTSWLEIRIREGKKHQIRHMTAAVGFPTLRLIRVAIDQITLAGLQPGEWRVETNVSFKDS